MVSARLLPADLDNSRYNNHANDTQQGSSNNNQDSLNEREEACLTLSFNGVEFCLTPADIMSVSNNSTSGNDTPFFSIGRKSNGMNIQLSNFSGSLLISKKGPSSLIAPATLMDEKVFSPPASKQRNTIHDESEDYKNHNFVEENSPLRSLRNNKTRSIDDNRRNSATPSPSGVDTVDSTQDPKLKEIVSSMPSLSVPEFRSQLKPFNSGGTFTPVASKQQNKTYSLSCPSFRNNTEYLSIPPVVVPPSASKKRDRNHNSTVETCQNNYNRTQTSVFDMFKGTQSKKTKSNIESTSILTKSSSSTTKSNNISNSQSKAEKQVHSSHDPPTLGQSLPSTQGSENLSASNSGSTRSNQAEEKPVNAIASGNVSHTVRDLVKESSQSDDHDNLSLCTHELMELEKLAKQEVNQNSVIVEVPMDGEGEKEAKCMESCKDVNEPNTSNNPEKGETGSNATIPYLKTPNIQNPAPRWGHTMTHISNDRLFVYGGQSRSCGTLSDIHVYHLKSRTWSKPINCAGLPRCWHTSTYIPSRQLLITFGGESFNAKTGRTTTIDQIMVFDTDIMLWYPPVCSGIKPNTRSGHSACLLPSTNTLVIVGGVRKGKWLNTVLALDTNRWIWSSPKVIGDAPRPRTYHSTTPISENRIVLFGGNDGKKCFNTIAVLDANGGEHWKWIYPNVTGTGPCPRTGHCATLLEDGKTILIHGGWDPNDDDEEDLIFDDCFLLDTSEWAWSKGPKIKYGGGGPEKGSKRVGHSTALVDGLGSKEVLSFGGRSIDNEFGNDFQVFTLEKNEVGLG